MKTSVECRTCKGDGEVLVHTLLNGHHPRTLVEPCPDCKGTGRRPEEAATAVP